MVPSKVNDDGPVAVIVKHPFAAVLPPTPLRHTFDPVWNRCIVVVLISMGLAFVAPATANDSPENAKGASVAGAITHWLPVPISPGTLPTKSTVVEFTMEIGHSLLFSAEVAIVAFTLTSDVNLWADGNVNRIGVADVIVTFW